MNRANAKRLVENGTVKKIMGRYVGEITVTPNNMEDVLSMLDLHNDFEKERKTDVLIVYDKPEQPTVETVEKEKKEMTLKEKDFDKKYNYALKECRTNDIIDTWKNSFYLLTYDALKDYRFQAGEYKLIFKNYHDFKLSEDLSVDVDSWHSIYDFKYSDAFNIISNKYDNTVIRKYYDKISETKIFKELEQYLKMSSKK